MASSETERDEPVDWALHPQNPTAWSQWKKWTTMLTACWVTFIVGLNATSITTASDVLNEEFGLGGGDLELNFFSVTAWNGAAAVVPLITLPLMDTYGVRYGYLVRRKEELGSYKSYLDANWLSRRRIYSSQSFSFRKPSLTILRRWWFVAPLQEPLEAHCKTPRMVLRQTCFCTITSVFCH